ncbi:HlyD family secretion protein [Desulforegula conservatrix]|uniref:HlyD family secretion protein n=1 Tax=Desulforegula conservatrix TaxID=153026 RepID=UPI00041B28D4|nr:efflux RND transporter periplasmic adaptor subunit [Desulforegula conservatrix]
MNKKKILPLVVIIIAVSYFSYKKIELNRYRNSGVVKVSGNIEITDADLGFKIPGKISKRLVSEGEKIKEGQAVAIMDSSDLEKEKALREAEVELAKSQLAELDAGSRPEEIAQAAALARSVKADVEKLKSDFSRQSELFRKKVISDKEYEASKAAYDSAQARLKEAQERLSLYELGPRSEKLDQARANLHHAVAALELAETRLGYACIYSPLSGMVLSHHAEPGEYVGAGTPVATVGDLEHAWIRAFISETDLGMVKQGQKAVIITDTWPDKKFEGTVSFISSQAEFTPKTVQTEKERVKLVYRIKIDVPNQDMELKPGMPADAEILTKQD